MGVDVSVGNTKYAAANYPYIYFPLAYLDTTETITTIQKDIEEKNAEIAEYDEKSLLEKVSKKLKTRKNKRSRI